MFRSADAQARRLGRRSSITPSPDRGTSRPTAETPAARSVSRTDPSELLGVSCSRLLDGTRRCALIPLAKSGTAALLGERVLDVEPRNSGRNHEVNVGLSPRVGVQGPEPEPKELRSGGIALEDWRTTAACEEPPHARAGLPASQEIFSVEEDEIGRPDSRCGAEARARVLAAPPAVAQGDRADEISADLVLHPSACA
jgi:hypothetical protein